MGAAMRVNSKSPVSGQARYRVGLAWRGFSRDTMRASLVALLGRMKSFGGFAVEGGRV